MARSVAALRITSGESQRRLEQAGAVLQPPTQPEAELLGREDLDREEWPDIKPRPAQPERRSHRDAADKGFAVRVVVELRRLLRGDRGEEGGRLVRGREHEGGDSDERQRVQRREERAGE